MDGDLKLNHRVVDTVPMSQVTFGFQLSAFHPALKNLSHVVSLYQRLWSPTAKKQLALASAIPPNRLKRRQNNNPIGSKLKKCWHTKGLPQPNFWSTFTLSFFCYQQQMTDH